MSRRTPVSVAASPALVGAVTVLVTIVAVFLAYNANSGLPFVATYDVAAAVPSAANLVPGNEVRVGGFRVGAVDRITPRRVRGRSIAVLHLQLDKAVEPLPADSRVVVRPRSALGLKYVELTPGTSDRSFPPGATIPLANARTTAEFDDFLGTFDAQLRADQRAALQGLGNALAGRGGSINTAVGESPGLLRSLTTVMDALNDESSELDELFVALARTAAEVAPVSGVQGDLFAHMAETLQALGADSDALRATIREAPPTLDTAITAFRTTRPLLTALTDVSERLRPAARELRGSLPTINRVVVIGQDVLPKTVGYNRRLGELFMALDELAQNPGTLLALRALAGTIETTGPLLGHVAPYQAVCNYFNYFFVPLGEASSQVVPGGTTFRLLNKVEPENSDQSNRFGAVGDEDETTPGHNRPADIPIDLDPDETEHFYALHGGADGPAVDSQGRADCQAGQAGFMVGPLLPPDRLYPPATFHNTDPPAPGERSALDAGGGSSVVLSSDIPYAGNGGRAGPTFDPNSADGLGPESLDEVP